MAEATEQPRAASARASDSAPAERRVAHTRESRPSEHAPDDDDDFEFSWTCLGITGAVITVLFGMLIRHVTGPVDPLDSKVEQFRNDEALRVVLWPGQAGGGGTRGPNGRDTDWAVFFYKCARLTPTHPHARQPRAAALLPPRLHGPLHPARLAGRTAARASACGPPSAPWARRRIRVAGCGLVRSTACATAACAR